MRILAIDLGKSKSVACDFEAATSQAKFYGLRTVPGELRELLVRCRPDRVVIEVCNQAGWVGDEVLAAAIDLQVVNTNGSAWRWQNVKRKTDRDDALKLAQLSAMNQLKLVHLPARPVRQWRSLIGYRQTLVDRRTAIKNRIRSILDAQAISMPAGKSGWTHKSVQALREMALPIEHCPPGDFWRAELDEELKQLDGVEAGLKRVTAELDKRGEQDERVRRLRTIPGVGRRLSEMVVAAIDDPHRFASGKQVASYAGLVPKQYQSGMMERHGRITGHGNANLRRLLVEVSWIGLRLNPRMRAVYERVRQGGKTRKKIAIVAVARRLLIWCWAMLRDKQDWEQFPEGSPSVRAA